MTTRVTVRREIVRDDMDADTSYLEQEGFEDRRKAYESGEFGFVGVQAVAEVKIPYGADFILSEIRSPGLWGIEDDSDEDYFESIYEEEKSVLRSMLAELGSIEVED